MVGQMNALSERYGRLSERQERTDERVNKHEFALFGFNGKDGGLMQRFFSLDEKVDALKESIDEKFSRLQKAVIGAIVTFCITGLPALVAVLVSSGSSH